MEFVKIILDNGIEENVNGIFYVFKSKYYFIYTTGEIEENDYVKLYVSQVCKEVKNTPTGPVDTGYMIGVEIKNQEEWQNVQQSITKIVEDKKNDKQSPEIQYLPINMLVNFKLVSKNKFKLMKHIVENNFKVTVSQQESVAKNNDINLMISDDIDVNVGIGGHESIIDNQDIEVGIKNGISEEPKSEVIIDYRTRFFEEQEKNQQLEEQIKNLNEKLENIKNIIG